MLLFPTPKLVLAPPLIRDYRLAGIIMLLAIALLYPGQANAGQTDGQEQGTVLQSRLSDDNELNPSLKVVPSAVLKGRAGTSDIQQYAADGKYHPGEAAPVSPPPKPPVKPLVVSGTAAAPQVAAPAGPAAVKPPPKWDYTATPNSGIMTWTPGTAVKVVQPLARASEPAPKQSTELRASQAQLPAPVAPPVVPLLATPQLLPSAATVAHAAPVSWAEWYQRVSRAIYDQWQRSATGPGDVRVRATIWRSHDVDCQIVDFTPARDVPRNADSETHFREEAIQCIYNLRRCEILGFPYKATKANVTFELDLKRDVNGPVGCDFGAISEMDENK